MCERYKNLLGGKDMKDWLITALLAIICSVLDYFINHGGVIGFAVGISYYVGKYVD
jgi:hypothetical protein